MSKHLVINCQTGQQEYIDDTPEEIAEAEARRVKITEDEAKEQEKAAKRTAALEKLKLDPKMADLLVALGLIEPL